MRQIVVEGKKREVPDGTTYLELAKEYQKDYPHDIILVLENGKMRELFRKVKDESVVEFLTTGHRDGHKTYKRGWRRSTESRYVSLSVRGITAAAETSFRTRRSCRKYRPAWRSW